MRIVYELYAVVRSTYYIAQRSPTSRKVCCVCSKTNRRFYSSTPAVAPIGTKTTFPNGGPVRGKFLQRGSVTIHGSTNVLLPVILAPVSNQYEFLPQFGHTMAVQSGFPGHGESRSGLPCISCISMNHGPFIQRYVQFSLNTQTSQSFEITFVQKKPHYGKYCIRQRR